MKRLLSFIISAALLMALFVPVSAASLSLEMEWDEVKCGEATTFTYKPSGGSGNYKYMINCVYLQDGSGYSYVVDPSRMPGYSEKNTSDFTFYVSGSYILYFYVMDMTALSYTRKIVYLTVDDERYPSAEEIADRLAEECLSAGCSTDYEKALWAHDKILEKCSYDYSYTYCGAEGALARGKGTCESYHRSYVMLLDRLGIESGRIEGNGHVWTAVKLDGKWYQTDLTWDDIEYSDTLWERHMYFCIPDDVMTLVHSEHSPHEGYESDSIESNYLVRSGEINTWETPLINSINDNLSRGKMSFSLDTPSSMPEAYKDVIYSIVAKHLETKGFEAAGKGFSIKAEYKNSQIAVSASEVSTVTSPLPHKYSHPFVDVNDSAWYGTAVGWAYHKGITRGTDETHFTPEKNLQVSEMVQLMYNASAESGTYPAGEHWYSAAQSWAIDRNYITGTTSMSTPCTRLQVVQMMYDAAGKPEITSEPAFHDTDEKAATWARLKGITKGTGNDLFSPYSTLTRAQAVQFIYNCYEK